MKSNTEQMRLAAVYTYTHRSEKNITHHMDPYRGCIQEQNRYSGFGRGILCDIKSVGCPSLPQEDAVGLFE